MKVVVKFKEKSSEVCHSVLFLSEPLKGCDVPAVPAVHKYWGKEGRERGGIQEGGIKRERGFGHQRAQKNHCWQLCPCEEAWVV